MVLQPHLKRGRPNQQGHIIRPKVKCLKWPSRGINFDPARQKCTRGLLNERSNKADRQTTNESVPIGRSVAVTAAS
jgi:hypothetical protein